MPADVLVLWLIVVYMVCHPYIHVFTSYRPGPLIIDCSSLHENNIN